MNGGRNECPPTIGNRPQQPPEIVSSYENSPLQQIVDRVELLSSVTNIETLKWGKE